MRVGALLTAGEGQKGLSKDNQSIGEGGDHLPSLPFLPIVEERHATAKTQQHGRRVDCSILRVFFIKNLKCTVRTSQEDIKKTLLL